MDIPRFGLTTSDEDKTEIAGTGENYDKMVLVSGDIVMMIYLREDRKWAERQKR